MPNVRRLRGTAFVSTRSRNVKTCSTPQLSGFYSAPTRGCLYNATCERGLPPRTRLYGD
jgi:hypothetical protein